MMSRHALTSLLMCLSFSAPLHAEVHSHGQGQVLIAQQNNQWVIELILPAADVLGFEHAPETQQQKNTIKQFKALTKSPENFVSLQPSCELVSKDLTLPSEKHDEHHGHGHENKHEKESHGDVQLSIEYRCLSQLEGITFPILKAYQSLATLSVEWITDNGQGATKVTSSNTGISF